MQKGLGFRSNTSLAAVADQLRSRKPLPSLPSPAAAKGRQAAVLVALFEDSQQQVQVLLTQRSKTLSSHSGEVALPGGKQDPEDADLVATALREAWEEVALKPELVTVLQLLRPLTSKHLYQVTPVIATIPEPADLHLRANAAEVAAIFSAPLELFLQDGPAHKRHRNAWASAACASLRPRR